jgi:hypothetical protein
MGGLPERGSRRHIGAHGNRRGINPGAERAAQQQLLPPSIELPAADAVLVRHRGHRRARLQALGHNLALLLNRPATAGLAASRNRGGLIASARMISRRTDPYPRQVRHLVVLRHGQHLPRSPGAAQRGRCCPWRRTTRWTTSATIARRRSTWRRRPANARTDGNHGTQCLPGPGNLSAPSGPGAAAAEQ